VPGPAILGKRAPSLRSQVSEKEQKSSGFATTYLLAVGQSNPGQCNQGTTYRIAPRVAVPAPVKESIGT
jgi:hypothetical protein